MSSLFSASFSFFAKLATKFFVAESDDEQDVWLPGRKFVGSRAAAVARDSRCGPRRAFIYIWLVCARASSAPIHCLSIIIVIIGVEFARARPPATHN